MRLPGLANLITLTRFVCIFLAGICIVSYTPEHDYYRWITLALVAIAIVSDIMDGKVARWLHQESYIGGLLDAIADALGFTFAFIFLYFFDLGMRFPLWFVAIVVGREIAVYGTFLVVILMKGRVDKKPSSLAKHNTELLALSILALLLHFEYSWAIWAFTSVTTLVTGADNVWAGIKALHSNHDESLENAGPDAQH
jgi:phosphatidylglycerophosphate synthase